MRIIRVRASAFGPFQDRTLEFAPGMTVIHGPNESGKSSWQAALYAGLCGMRRGPGLRKEDREFRDRHRPWDGADWSVIVDVELDDRRCLELHQDLDGNVDCRVIDRDTGKDVTSELLHDGAPDGSKLLGLNRQMFLTTVCVRQADVLAVLEHADDLQEQLQRAAATGGREANAEEAIRRIDVYQREHVGTDRVNSTKPLRTAMNRKTDAEQALQDARTAHESYLELVRQRDRAEDHAKETGNEQALVAAAVEHDRFRRLEKRLQEARSLARQLEEAGRPELPDAELTDAVEEAVSAFRNRPQRPEPLDGPSAADIAAEIAGLPQAPEGDTEAATEIENVFEQWREAHRRLDDHRQQRPEDPEELHTGGATPTELRQAADDLEASAPPVDTQLEQEVSDLRAGADAPARGSHMGVWVAVGAMLAAVALAAVQQLPAAAGALVVALLAAAFSVTHRGRTTTDLTHLQQLEARLELRRQSQHQAETRRTAARERCEAWSLAPDPATLRRLARQMEDVTEHANEVDRWDEKETRLSSALADAERRLRSLLGTHGVDEAANVDRGPDELMQEYRQACRNRADQAGKAAQRQALERTLEATKRAEAAFAATTNQRDEAARKLLAVAQRVGLPAHDADEALPTLEQWLTDYEAARDLQHKVASSVGKLEQLLDGRTIEDLEAEVEQRRSKLPAPPPDDVDLADDMDRHLKDVEAAAREARREADRLAGQVLDRERELPSVAEAEEVLEEAKRELARVRRLDADLKRAQDFLTEARDRVHRDIAPVLATAVKGRLPTITHGRYVDAIVDPSTLGVQVRTVGGQLRDATRLSHGTTEQIYLLLRLAMAEHLVTTGETAPLILDDALVQTDSDRSAAFLDVLHDLSSARQVILFSQEDDVLSWARTNLSSRDRLEELDPSLIRA